MSTSRLEFLGECGVIVEHDTVVATIGDYPRILRVRNLDDEIWLVRDALFVPIGEPSKRLIENAVVDRLSVSNPLLVFNELKKLGVKIETVGWKT